MNATDPQDPARLRAEALQDARTCLRRAQSAIAAASSGEVDHDCQVLLGSAHAAAQDALDAVSMVLPR